MHINVPEHVEHPSAYIDAANARIRANARKTFEKLPRAIEASDFLQYGGARGGFLEKMAKTLNEFGKLSEGQLLAVLRIIDDRKAEQERRHQPVAGGKYVGEVGKRSIMTLTAKRMFRHDDPEGVRYFFICETPEGATVVYGGSVAIVGNEGESVTVKATVKEHGQRKGYPQTVIQRPKVQA